MSEHWQDNICPFCGAFKHHKLDCEWPEILARYKARQAAGENPAIPDGIETMVEMSQISKKFKL